MVWAVRLIKGIICDKYRDKHELSIMIRHYDEFIAMNSILLLYTNNLIHLALDLVKSWCNKCSFVLEKCSPDKWTLNMNFEQHICLVIAIENSMN